MENELNIKDAHLNEELELKDNNIFKLDYENQNVDNNINYLNWKNSNIKEYGNNAKLFKCKKCKILLYSKNEDNIKEPYYSKLCPICKKYICYFCSYSYNYSKYDHLYCCFKRVINISFLISGVNYLKEKDLFDCDNLLFLIPIMNILGLFLRTDSLLFYSRASEKSKKEGKFEEYSNNEFYEKMLYIIPFVLGIPYFLIDAYHLIFLYLISIPFKLYPLKYYLGFVDIKSNYFK